jgi:hypothetical protein
MSLGEAHQAREVIEWGGEKEENEEKEKKKKIKKKTKMESLPILLLNKLGLVG